MVIHTNLQQGGVTFPYFESCFFRITLKEEITSITMREQFSLRAELFLNLEKSV
jgi:hypothetical protein